jgi:Zn-dependent protease with chaperone function
MNSQPRLVGFFSKSLFIFFLGCLGVDLAIWIPQAQSGNFLCCVFNTSDPGRPYMVNMPLILLFSLIGAGFLVAGCKIIKTQQEVNRLLDYADKKIPTNVKQIISAFNPIPDTVVLSVEEPCAFCFGFLHPRICLSKGIVKQLSPQELKATILHEVAHYQRFDPMRILLIQVICTAMFFLPAIREWGKNYEIEMELKADRFAIKHAGKSALAGAMRYFANLQPASAAVASSAIFSRFAGTAARVEELLTGKPWHCHISNRSLLQSSVSIFLICTLLFS